VPHDDPGMERGFSGACPYVDLADVFASAFDLWHAGKKRQAFDMFGRTQAFASITPVSSVDIMIAAECQAGDQAPHRGTGGRGGRRARWRRRGCQHAGTVSIEEIRKELDAI